MKIRIIGCSGSGKTYLAKRLSERYNIPSFDLDDIQWDNSQNSYGVKMPIEKRNRMLNDILQQPNWIIEGVYYAWVQKSFEDADVIYVLDMPKRLYRYRIIKRFIKRKVGLEKGKKETLNSVCELLKWTNTFQNTNMKEIIRILEPHKEKVVYIKKKEEIYKIITD
ncbi:MAG: DNA topology modulation protein FlaR [Ruminococcaceae bacterium]|nr:DNA topology modulation protein FlaR [Oscillospiraceae bacterium]